MKRPKLPRKLRILTREYRVRYNGKIADCGECDRPEATIEINSKLCGNDEQIIRTLWHEIGHAFAWESGLTSAGIEGKVEEMFVESFSALICDLTGGKFKGS